MLTNHIVALLRNEGYEIGFSSDRITDDIYIIRNNKKVKVNGKAIRQLPLEEAVALIENKMINSITITTRD